MNYESMSIDDLLRECAKGSDEAWTEFIRRFHRLIAGVVIKSCREWSETSPGVIEDLIQEVYLKLCANHCSILVNFKSEHPNAFLGFLKKLTANLVYDYFRRPVSPAREREKTASLDEVDGQIQTGSGEAKQMEDEVFRNEIDSILLARGSGPVEQKERAIFWLWYQQGFTAKEIALLPDINLGPKGVESLIYRITKHIKATLLKRRGKDPGKGFQAAEPF